MAIMRDQNDGSLEMGQGLLKNVGACNIKMIGGLVQAKQGPWRNEHLGKGEPALLPARQNADKLINVIVAEQERPQQRTNLRDAPSGSHSIKLLEDSVIGVQLLQLMLGEVGLAHVRAVGNRALLVIKGAGDHLEQGGLTCTVRTHQGDFLTTIQLKIQALVNTLVAKRFGNVFKVNHKLTSTWRLLEIEMHGLAFFGNLDDLHFLELFYAILNLLGLGRLIPKPLDECFHLLDFVLLLCSLFFKPLQPLGALLQICGVIARVSFQLPAIDFGNTTYHVVQKLTVVRHHQNRTLI